ncbi:MAG TPA: VWA domain-containing protein [Acidimicrobiales bacterium]
MRFLVAWRLWLLLGVGGMLGAWLASLFRRRRDVVRFTNVALLDVVAPERSAWRRHLPAGLWLAAMALLVLGFARPVRTVQEPEERATVVLALDVSNSMEADDVDPSRIEVAKAAALDFLEELPPQLDVGLVLFSGTISSVPVTEDREAVAERIEEAELADSTAIGEAIFTALDLVADAPPAADGSVPPARIVVLSDGETTVGRPDGEAAAAAAEAGVPVDTIAFGTPDGVVEDDFGVVTPVAVMPGPLRDIAEATGGEFAEADSAGSLRTVYDAIATVVGYEEVEREISGWFVGAGLALLAVAGMLSLLWSQRLP